MSTERSDQLATVIAASGGQAPRRHSTAGEFIVDSLREAILTGRLEAGAPLPLDRLAEQFGTSVIPIREALRRLEAERLVVLRPHRTAQVAELSSAELKDLYRVRLLLDPEAVRLAHGHLTPADLQHMRDLADQMESHFLAGEELEAFAAHAEFHHTIFRAAGSPSLSSILERLWDETERYRHADRHYLGDARLWGDEHRRLVDLLEQGTPGAAAGEMREHLTRTLHALVRARGEVAEGGSAARRAQR